MKRIHGFSNLSADEKLDALVKSECFTQEDLNQLVSFRHPDSKMQALFEKFTENVVSAYHLPFSIAPNFLINDILRHLPMVVEESSVVAAASWSAKFWSKKGGFRTQVISEEKIGQIHFRWTGDFRNLLSHSDDLEQRMRQSVENLTRNMDKRGGGIHKFEWINLSQEIDHIYQCRISFLTADSMGANFINSTLETMGKELQFQVENQFPDYPKPEVIMAILSNYTPDCIVECTIECPIKDLGDIRGVDDPHSFAEKFLTAVQIAEVDPYRAVTHNKGIFNGMDAVVLATANDFRAFEAGGHAYASRSGKYSSLTHGSLSNGMFTYTLKVPMAIGTIGGLTSTHPLAALSLLLLGNPNAPELMQIIAAAGMANNFSALKALVTSGIQSGHMKMHLSKILIQLGANTKETEETINFFKDKTVSFSEVTDFINNYQEK